MAILTDDTYVDKAQDVIGRLKTNKFGKYSLTTSKIRNLLSMTSALFDESKAKRFDQLTDKLAYLRVQYVYQAGREAAVRDLVEKGEILEALKEVHNTESLQRFCRYMEALVAYFRYHGGKD